MLHEYNKKRDFKQTKEPSGKAAKPGRNQLVFVVQRHHATRVHYDFRLQLNGVLKSWAVPKGPSLNTDDKRLAVMVEDHPFDYKDFYGTIPKGNYGAGDVEIWDEGLYYPIDEEHQKVTQAQAIKNLEKGELKILLAGTHLKGEFVLVRLKKEEENWLLIKHKDEYAVAKEYQIEKIKSIKKKEAERPLDKAKTKAVAKKTSEKKLAEKETASFKRNENSTRSKAKVEIRFSKIKPMLATAIDKVFDDDGWLYEMKWDGYRTIAVKQGDDVQLWSRNEISFNKKFAAIAEAVRDLILHDAILDGEVVAMVNGKASFQALQHADETKPELRFYLFDLLKLDETWTTELPLIDRKKLLEQLLKPIKSNLLAYTPHVLGKGGAFYAKIVKKGLEGIMAKQIESEYTPGVRTKQWLKIKNRNDKEAIIVGYTEPSGGRNYFGAIVLAVAKGKTYKYIGHAGTGFDEVTLKSLYKLMQPLVADKSPFLEKVKVNAPVTWLKPKLVCTVFFTEETSAGILRHPVFGGLRDDKAVNDVSVDQSNTITSNEISNPDNMETANENSKNQVLEIEGKKLAVTNTDKIFFPERKITKGDVIAYYHSIAKYILPYLKNRPLSLKRNPNGIHEESFFHKNAGDKAPSWIKTFEVFSESSNRDIEYIICNNTATLIYLANLGSIEINPWNSTYTKPENPTYIIIDIDPSDGNTFEQVIETALAVKEVADKAKLSSYCKTSGASGLHVYIPLGGKYDYDAARTFAEIIATHTHELVPGFTSLTRSLKKRGDNIYIDFLQNRRGQTLASAYSLRPVPDASVSTPLEWKEVKSGLHPSQFDLLNIQDRIEKKGDLFKDVLTGKNNMRLALKLLGA
jgi:bifunctional non-homologous end joining protein LigD